MLQQQPIDSPYQPAGSAGRQMAGANSTQGGYQPPGYLQYQPMQPSAVAKPQQPSAPGDTGQLTANAPAASKTPMGAVQSSSSGAAIPPPQGAPSVGTNGQSATAAPMNAQAPSRVPMDGPSLGYTPYNPVPGANQPAQGAPMMPAANAPQQGANGQPASIANLGSTIDAQLQNPNPYKSADVENAYNFYKGDLNTQLNQNLAATDANAASRGMFYSTPASDAQSWQRAQYQRALGSLATNMTQMQAQGQLQGQEQANQAALGFTGQAQNADAQQMEAAIQAGQLGLAGGPTAQTAMYGSAFMPSPDFGSVYPQAFSALGGLFATPQQQNPYSYNPAQAPRGAAGGNAQYRPQQ